MKKFKTFLYHYAGMPFLASLLCLVVAFFGIEDIFLYVVPVLTLVFHYVFRKETDLEAGVKINGCIVLGLLIIFTLMMVYAKGNLEGAVMSCFSWAIFPFAPAIFVMQLMGQTEALYLMAFVTYAAAFVFYFVLAKPGFRKIVVPVLVAIGLIGANTYLYMNRPAARYAGHGFQYMNGFSSTDFSDYMVYSKNSKLVTLDHEAAFQIEKEEDMPVLDGAEACYPLYAAFAKAVYKDIDVIEEKAKDEYFNGNKVSFSNTIRGFGRLISTGKEWAEESDRVDMFFGAKPSSEQMQEAKDAGVELDITPIGKEAFVFFVEADNPIDSLTTEQIKGIYHGDITNWKEVGGPDQKIRAFQRPNNSGSQTMMVYFMGETSLKEPETYDVVGAMEGVIRQVAQYANEDGAMGYSFRYFVEGLNQEKNVKLISIDGVAPTVENIENGSYPLTVGLVMITRKDDPNPNVQKMKEFILSEDGQYIIRQTGYGGLN